MTSIHRYDIWISFCISTIVQYIMWPLPFYYSCPSFNNLLLIYWIVLIPDKVNIGTSFIIGLITNIFNENILGTQSLILSITSYLIIHKIKSFFYLPIYQQSLIIFIISFTNTISDHIIQTLIINNYIINLEILWEASLHGLFWPIILLIMNKINNIKY